MCSYLHQIIYIIVLRRYYCWVYFYLMIKSGKSFIKIGSHLQITFFLFYQNFHSHPPSPTPPSSSCLFQTLSLFDIYLVYLFVYLQFIYRWQILFQFTIRLAFHKQQGLAQTSGAISNIAECLNRWHQTFETESQY